MNNLSRKYISKARIVFELIKKNGFVFFLNCILRVFYSFFEAWLNYTIHSVIHDISESGGVNDYIRYIIPKIGFVQRFFQSFNLSKERFALIGLVILVFFSFFSYFSKRLQHYLVYSGFFYCRIEIMKKFRRLGLEERLKQKNPIYTLITKDAAEASDYIESFLGMISFLSSLAFSFLFWFEKLLEMSITQRIIFVLILAISIAFVFWISSLVKKEEWKAREESKAEWNQIDKTLGLVNVMDNMGVLNEEGEKLERLINRSLKNWLSGSNLRVFEDTGRFASEKALVFLLIFFSKNGTDNTTIHALSDFFPSIEKVFFAFKNFWSMNVSLSRIKNFFTLPEKNDNLNGIRLENNVLIKSVEFKNVCFRYQNQKEFLFLNYNKIFVSESNNHFSGKNGLGKSTLIYLLLGTLCPEEGKIIINLANGNSFDLFKEMNLLSWRESNVVYLSHKTLLSEEEGSTGEKQWKSITFLLNKKKEALLYIFDEADNGLDKEKRALLQQIIKEKVSQGKLVIYIRHI